jgi:hypothetical protein
MMQNNRPPGGIPTPFRDSPLPPDAFIPVLTDVLHRPAETSATAPTPRALGATMPAPALTAALTAQPSPENQALHSAVMAELRAHLEPLVIDRVREQIEPLIQAAMLKVLAQVNAEVARLIEDAVWRAVNSVSQSPTPASGKDLEGR